MNKRKEELEMSLRNRTVGITIILAITIIMAGAIDLQVVFAQSWKSELILPIMVPTTGRGAIFGTGQLIGAQIAVDAINAKGGIGGNLKIKLDLLDDQTNPEQGISLYKKTAPDALIILGPLFSTVVEVLAPIANIYKTPFVAYNEMPGTAERSAPWGFRFQMPADKRALSALPYWLEKRNIKRVGAIIDKKEASTAGAGVVMVDHLKSIGKLAGSVDVMYGQLDVSAEVSKLKGINPDGIMIFASDQTGAVIIKEFDRQNVKVPILGWPGLQSPGLVESVGNIAEGMWVYTTFWAEDPALKGFVTEFQKRRGKEPISYDILSHDSVYLVASCIQKAGITNDPKKRQSEREKMRDCIAGTKDLPGLLGKYSITSYGATIPTVILRLSKGRWEFIEKVGGF